MEKRKRIVEYRDRLDKTLASHDLVNEKSIKNLVRSQLIHSSPSDTHGYIENYLEKRTTEVSNFLDMLRSASVNVSEVSKNDGISHRDWKLKQDNEDFRVMYREGPEGTPFHSLLVEGYVDGPLDVCLCLSWEAALFRKWWPQFSVPPFKITTCDCLQEVRIGEQIIQMRVKVAWPLSAREAILHYFELEYLEDDLIIVLLKSISDTEGIDRSTNGFSRDGIPDAEDLVRIDVVGGFVLQRVTSNISYFRTISTMDIKLDFVPPSLINFFSRQLIGGGFKLYKKTVASIAKGDEDFSKALQSPLYVRVREGLPKNKPNNNLKAEPLDSDKYAAQSLDEAPIKIPQVDTILREKITFSDSRATTSSQAGIQNTSQAYKCEIEELDVEQEIQSEEKGQTSHAKIEQEAQLYKDKVKDYFPTNWTSDVLSHAKIEQDIEQEAQLYNDKVKDHSTTNWTADGQSIKVKASISSEVENALRVLDNAISMVRKGFSIPNWSGFGSNNHDHLNLERVATEVGSHSSEDTLDDRGCAKEPKVDNTEALEEDDSSSGLFDIRHDKQDSPLREVNRDLETPASTEQSLTPLSTSQDNTSYSTYNGKVFEAPVLDNMSKEFIVNAIHEGCDSCGNFEPKKQRRCCLYFFAPGKYNREPFFC